MSVLKFRTVDELNQPRWHSPGDPRLYDAIAAVWDLARQMSPRTFPHGVYRFRSIEEMSAQRNTWEAEHVRRVAAQNAAAPVAPDR